MASLGFDDLLNAKTESEFFITICTLLSGYRREGIKCSTELTLNTAGRSNLQFTLYMVLLHQRAKGQAWNRDKVWVFTLYRNGELCWDKADFEALEPGLYGPPQHTRITGLTEIKHVMRDARGMFKHDLLNAGVNTL